MYGGYPVRKPVPSATELASHGLTLDRNMQSWWLFGVHLAHTSAYHRLIVM